MHKQSRPPVLLLALFAGFLALGVALWFFSIENRRTEAYFTEVTTTELYKTLDQARAELDTVRGEISFRGEFSNPTFLFEDQQLALWSDFRLVPTFQSINHEEELHYFELSQGKYLAASKDLGNNQLVVQLIELYTTPPFTNQYIKPEINAEIFPSATVSIDEADVEAVNIKTREGKDLFGVKFDMETPVVQPEVQAFITILIFTGLIFAFIYLNSWSWFLAEAGRVWTGVSLLAIGLVAMRLIMLRLSFPFNIYGIDLFNPRFYASSIYNPSLGDLLINTLFALSLTTFIFRYILKSDLGSNLGGGSKIRTNMFLIMVNLMGLMALSFHYGLLEDILVNSQIELDINKSLQFSSFRVVSILIFFASTVVWFQTTHFVYTISVQLAEDSLSWAIAYVIAGIAFALAGWWFSIEVGFILIAQTLYLGLALKFKLPEYLSRLSYSTLFYFFAASLLSSLIGTIAIYENHEYQESVQKQRFANDLLLENDLKGEYLLHEAVSKIKKDVFIQSRLLSPQISREQIEQKVKGDFLGSYFDKYDLKVKLFDNEGRGFVKMDEDSTFKSIESQYTTNDFYKTDYPNLYFVGNVDEEQPIRYLSIIPIQRYGNSLGHVVLDLRLKKVIPKTVYPELLVDSRFSDYHKSFDYAFYSGVDLNYKAGDFNYYSSFDPAFFENPRLYSKGIEREGFHHLGIKRSDNRTLVITSEVYPNSFVVSNFSFIFLCLVLGILLLLLINSIDRTRAIKLNFGSKIQLYLNLAFFVPLVITSVLIINTLNKSYQEEIDRSSVKKVNLLMDQSVRIVDAYIKNRINRESLSAELNAIARYTQSDLNLFDTTGRLITSSQPLIFSNNLLSDRINPVALGAILEDGKEAAVLNEFVGKLAYKSTYAPIKSFETGEVLGIFGVPFFGSKNHLERQTTEAFTTILNVFTIVLIASLFVSNFASRLLTHPLNLLTQKIRKTSLAAHNEPLEWQAQDEIGMVVDEYNKMLVNLEQSKDALAKSQKESAWREIAQQVAHEIKNPLTPMKLSLQHLKRVMGDEKDAGEYQKPIDNLLYQIDSLNDIATSFSTFAKMPIPENERFEFCQEVKRIVELFDNENVDLKVVMSEEGLFINGDQKLMGRIVSNLIINGMQSVDEGSKPQVQVSVKSNGKKVTLEVKDNGTGIPEEIQSKVFVPNFSTKDSGSGIGLAVAKRGIEHAGGNIWFETELGKGTTFFVDLPLIA